MKRLMSASLRWLKGIGVGLLALVVAATLFGSIYEAVARERAHGRYPPPGRMVDIGGRKIHIDCRGTGSPTVVLESGLDTFGSLSWEKVQSSAAQLTRTCSYDRAGVMWSEAKSGAQDADAVAEDLHAALEAGGIVGPLVLVCHSFGGPYVMDFTRKYGDQVKGLVFVDCSHPDQLTKLRFYTAPRSVPFLYKALVALRWTGVARLIPSGSAPDIPERTKTVSKAYLGESTAGVGKELASIRPSLREGGQLRNLGDRPLVVLTAMQPYSKAMLKAVGLTEREAATQQADLY